MIARSSGQYRGHTKIIMISITMMHEPIAKMRHRMARTNSGVRSYDPQASWKEEIKRQMAHELSALSLGAESPTYEDPYWADLEFGFARSKTCKSIHHRTKPDIDNLMKFYFDCGNGILWRDDRLIVRVSARKIYAPYPYVKIKISPCGEA